MLTDLLTADVDDAGCSWTGPPSAALRAGQADNYGLIWTPGILLRNRRSHFPRAWRPNVSVVTSTPRHLPGHSDAPVGTACSLTQILFIRPVAQGRSASGWHHAPDEPEADRDLRRGLRRLPAARPVHHRQRRPLQDHPPARGPAARRPRPGQDTRIQAGLACTVRDRADHRLDRHPKRPPCQAPLHRHHEEQRLAAHPLRRAEPTDPLGAGLTRRDGTWALA